MPSTSDLEHVRCLTDEAQLTCRLPARSLNSRLLRRTPTLAQTRSSNG